MNHGVLASALNSTACTCACIYIEWRSYILYILIEK